MSCRKMLYDGGRYMTIRDTVTPFASFIGDYSMMQALTQITDISSDNTPDLLLIYNALPHDPYLLKKPGYIPASNIKYNGPDAYVEAHYDCNMASYMVLAKWFKKLKQNGAYNNTRIIIVSDHGFSQDENPLSHRFPDILRLPNGMPLDCYRCLLLEKDFNTHGGLKNNDAFMTNADVPFLASEGLSFPAVNPYTGNKLRLSGGKATITTSTNNGINSQNEYTYKIAAGDWLSVHTNIFDVKNWKKVQAP
jgi:hypothetical protein